MPPHSVIGLERLVAKFALAKRCPSSSSYVAGVVEWIFAESQSSIQGRTGNNACAFIALIMGKMWINGSSPWPRDILLPKPWKQSLYIHYTSLV